MELKKQYTAVKHACANSGDQDSLRKVLENQNVKSLKIHFDILYET